MKLTDNLSGKTSEVTLSITQSIVQYLLEQGLSPEDIIMPGGAENDMLFISADFDVPLDDFKEYLN